MSTIINLLPAALAISIVLIGCSGDTDEFKKLGFSSAGEMKTTHQKGWHTKEKFNEDMQKIFEQGQADIKVNQTESGFQKITEAAESGIVNAQSMLGIMYSNGVGVSKDLKKSAVWHIKAANAGNINSQYLLYTIYFSGIGVEQDFKKSYESALKSANQGFAPGQLAVGMSFEGGTGVDKDMKKAADWYEKSANAGNVTAMFRLGRLYVIGEGVEHNEKKGLALVQQAANKGDVNAITLIKKLRRSSYKNLVSCLHPYAPGLAATLAANLMKFASSNSYAFGSALNSSTYAQYCQMAAGTPGDENIQMANKIAESGNNIYWVADRGQAAVGFIEHR